MKREKQLRRLGMVRFGLIYSESRVVEVIVRIMNIWVTFFLNDQ